MPFVVIGLFLLGSCLGSFLNVVILRSIDALKISEGSGGLVRRSFSVGGRSQCPRCHQQLRWWELVPVLSFIFLRGRCQRCHEKISIQYPLVELTMGTLVVLLASPLPATPPELALVLLHIAIAALLVILFVIDLKTMLLPDSFVGLLLVAVVLENVFRIQNLEFRIQNAVFGIAIGAGFLLLLWILTRGKGIGLGDVKLMIPLGLLFGPLATVALLFLAYTVGGLLAVYLLLQKKATLKTAVPFGPFLCGAAMLLLILPALPERLVEVLLGYNPWL